MQKIPLIRLSLGARWINIGNKGRQFSITSNTHDSLENFWELIDEVLNAILFLLLGLELLIIQYNLHLMLISLAAIPLVLLIRLATVGLPMSLFKLKKTYSPYFVSILVWGGLREGLAVALALAMPPNQYRAVILTMIYAIVVFSVVVQGLSMKPLVERSKEIH